MYKEPTAWTIYGIVTSQIGNKSDLVEVPGSAPISVKDYLEKHMGYEYDFLGAAVAAHIAFPVLFLFVFAYGIRFLNFQRR